MAGKSGSDYSTLRCIIKGHLMDHISQRKQAKFSLRRYTPQRQMLKARKREQEEPPAISQSEN